MDALRLVVTSRCNLKCLTCLRANRKQEDLPLPLIASVLRQATELGCRRITLTGGEPCLHPQFREIVGCVAESGLGLQVLSNGSLLDRLRFLATEYSDALSAITLSLDGASAATHDHIRAPGSFDALIRTASYFRSHGCTVRIQTCITRTNLSEIREISMLANRLGAAKHVLTWMVPTPYNQDLMVPDTERLTFMQRLRLLREGDVGQRRFIFNSPRPDSPDYCHSLTSLEMLTITTQGLLAFCCEADDTESTLGSLADETLEHLFHKATLRAEQLKARKSLAIAHDSPDRYLGTCEFCRLHLHRLTPT